MRWARTKTGRRSCLSSNRRSSAYRAALALSVSNIVSTRNRSTPPSSSDSACSTPHVNLRFVRKISYGVIHCCYKHTYYEKVKGKNVEVLQSAGIGSRMHQSYNNIAALNAAAPALCAVTSKTLLAFRHAPGACLCSSAPRHPAQHSKASPPERNRRTPHHHRWSP